MVNENGESSKAFAVTNGVKQSCVLAPTLFSVMLSVMLVNAFGYSTTGIKIQYCLDGKCFSTRWFVAKTKVLEDIMLDSLFAGDCASTGRTPEKCKTV